LNIRPQKVFPLRLELIMRYTDSMRRFLFFALMTLCLLPTLTIAQVKSGAAPRVSPFAPSPEGEVTRQPICSKLTNRSTVTIQGTIALAPQTLTNGESHQFSNNFKLSPGERQDVCASGPFYEGRRIELTIRTLFPLFSCKTALGQEIFLDMKQRDDGIKEYSATCR
jgi:hypothetical protein